MGIKASRAKPKPTSPPLTFFATDLPELELVPFDNSKSMIYDVSLLFSVYPI